MVAIQLFEGKCKRCEKKMKGIDNRTYAVIGWGVIALCPKCTKTFEEMMQDFLHGK